MGKVNLKYGITVLLIIVILITLMPVYQIPADPGTAKLGRVYVKFTKFEWGGGNWGSYCHQAYVTVRFSRNDGEKGRAYTDPTDYVSYVWPTETYHSYYSSKYTGSSGNKPLSIQTPTTWCSFGYYEGEYHGVYVTARIDKFGWAWPGFYFPEGSSSTDTDWEIREGTYTNYCYFSSGSKWAKIWFTQYLVED